MNSRSKKKITTIRILIVDDHPAIGLGLTELINQEDGFLVCGYVENEAEALPSIRQNKPDIVILDVGLKRISGMEVLKNIKAEFPSLRVLMYSVYDEILYSSRALRAGAAGYLAKSRPLDELLLALRRVSSGEGYVSHPVASLMNQRLLNGQSDALTSPIEGLSDRELEIFELLGSGLSSAQIAEKVGLALTTVNFYRGSIRKKLKITGPRELMSHAVRWTREGSLRKAVDDKQRTPLR